MANQPSLPIFQDLNKNFMLHQTSWKAAITPVIQNELNQGLLITNVALSANTPLAINHMLSRLQIGWQLTDITTNSNIWRTQPFNSSTLTLESSADTTISLWVF
jgi:hypothetical protein